MSAIAEPSVRSSSRAWRKLRANKSALVGATIVTLFVVLALLAPVLPIANPSGTDWGAIRKPPSAAAWMGTDEIGRDVLSRMIWGRRRPCWQVLCQS